MKPKAREDERRQTKQSNVSLDTPFRKDHFRVTRKAGPKVIVERKDAGKSYIQNSAHLKKIDDGEGRCLHRMDTCINDECISDEPEQETQNAQQAISPENAQPGSIGNNEPVRALRQCIVT